MFSSKRFTASFLMVILLVTILFSFHSLFLVGDGSLPYSVIDHNPKKIPNNVLSSSNSNSEAEKTGKQPPAAITGTTEAKKPKSNTVPVSYDKTTPPGTGCERVVVDAQKRLVKEYSKLLKGIRYANIWGYLETENKGDAAIWAAQQILMSTLGITYMESCRFLDKECDLEKFNSRLASQAPHSAILIAGGGNFNDFYWEDQPSRIAMVQAMHAYPIRSFPQSIHMTYEDRINATVESYVGHPDIQLAARDASSFEFLEGKFEGTAVSRVLTPDIAFMWGSREDFRVDTPKSFDILILARNDWEISTGDSAPIPFGKGILDLGGTAGKLNYLKVDWKSTKTPGIDSEEVVNEKGEDTGESSERENGKNQRAWAKAVEGFRILGSAKFIITDRLHGHIMATIIGTPHVLMDSKLKKNSNYHDTWTKDCECTRVADNIDEALGFAKMFFEQ